MKKNKVILMVLFVVSIVNSAVGQQNALFTQYIDAQLYSNPAVAGSNDVLSISGIHRQQWVGLKGAPLTTGLMIHTPLHYESIGIGFEVWNDRLGALNRSTLAGNFAYRFKFKNGGKVSIGIKAIADLNATDLSDIENAIDDPRSQVMKTSFQPNAGVGILYKSSKWFMGVGAPRILSNNDTTSNGGYTSEMDAYFLTGAIIDMQNKWKFRPSTQVRLGQLTSLSIDVTATFIKNEVFYIGFNYRVAESAGVLTQYQISPQFKIGYSFDFLTRQSLRSTNFGSHEISLSYNMNFTKALVTTPRFF